MDQGQRLRGETVAVWATVVCFVLGTAAGFLLLGPEPRMLIGTGSLALPAASAAGVIAGGAFVVSTLRHRRGETAPMPRWQRIITDISAIALTVAFAGVAGMGVLLGTQVLAIGLQGLELTLVGGALVTAGISYPWGFYAFAVTAVLAVLALATVPARMRTAAG